MNTKIITGIIALAIAFSGTSCIKTDTTDTTNNEKVLLASYVKLIKNNYLKTLKADTSYHRLDTTLRQTADGLYYILIDSGMPGSTKPVSTDYALVNFTGRLDFNTPNVADLNGKIFETNDPIVANAASLSNSTLLTGPAYIGLSNLTITGMIEGLKLMCENSRARLIIPSSLAFGSYYTARIPSYSTLVYDVNLVKIIHNPIAYDSTNIVYWAKTYKLNPVDSLDNRYYIKVETTGTGDTLSVGKNYYIHYRAKLLDGRYFFIDKVDPTLTFTFTTDSTYKDSILYTVGVNTINKGFDVAIQNFRVGSSGKFLIPYPLAWGAGGLYNQYGQTAIPVYNSAFFEIKKISAQ
jgi:FKBP-type peptidyl-prolyl cis-trans isomerase